MAKAQIRTLISQFYLDVVYQRYDDGSEVGKINNCFVKIGGDWAWLDEFVSPTGETLPQCLYNEKNFDIIRLLEKAELEEREEAERAHAEWLSLEQKG